MAGLGTNLTDKAVLRVGKCLKVIKDMTRSYDVQNGVQMMWKMGVQSACKKTERQDCDKIVEQLNEMVFECIPGRKHATFQTLVLTLLELSIAPWWCRKNLLQIIPNVEFLSRISVCRMAKNLCTHYVQRKFRKSCKSVTVLSMHVKQSRVEILCMCRVLTVSGQFCSQH